MSQRYSHELYRRTPLADASKLITSNQNHDMNLDFVITDKGQYAGVGKTRQLLKHITDLQLRSARYSNPLTLLPGNVPLYEHVDELLSRKQHFYIAYCDLNDFKPFNDYFGYDKGDDVIKYLAQCIEAECKANHDFIGHIGGDDFILVLTTDDWKAQCRNILQRFISHRDTFYDEQSLLSGGIWGVDRANNRRLYDLLSLSIGAANPNHQHCHSHHDVAALAASAKKQAKARGGNNLYVLEETR
jgi:diguanylate cyclase (GGDEF)-like protein